VPIPGTGGIEFIQGEEPIVNEQPVDIDNFLNDGSKRKMPPMMVPNQQMNPQQMFMM